MFAACQWRGIKVIWFVNVCRLPMARDINDSVRKWFPCQKAGEYFWKDVKMTIRTGYSYHIKDDFFTLINDSFLMSNKEGQNYRPHFFFINDPNDPDVFWAIPQSTQVQKYREIINNKIAKYGICDTIVIGRFGGRENAFLIQNMFPVIAKYVDHEHTINGQSVHIHNDVKKRVTSCAAKVLNLYYQGKKLIFPDIERIFQIMQNEKQI